MDHDEAIKQIDERLFALDLLQEFKKANRRMYITVLVLILVLVASNFYWLYTFTQYDFISQDGEGVNVGGRQIETGEIYNGSETENKERQ